MGPSQMRRCSHYYGSFFKRLFQTPTSSHIIINKCLDFKKETFVKASSKELFTENKLFHFIMISFTVNVSNKQISIRT